MFWKLIGKVPFGTITFNGQLHTGKLVTKMITCIRKKLSNTTGL